jgi:putative PIN family toxin of toxin-antitoxin system
MESKQADRVIIDTNLWISFLISKDFSKLDHLVLNNKLRFIFSKELLSEFIDVSGRPKLQKYFEMNDLVQLMDRIENYSETIIVKSKINLCRDITNCYIA